MQREMRRGARTTLRSVRRAGGEVVRAVPDHDPTAIVEVTAGELRSERAAPFRITQFVHRCRRMHPRGARHQLDVYAGASWSCPSRVVVDGRVKFHPRSPRPAKPKAFATPCTRSICGMESHAKPNRCEHP